MRYILNRVLPVLLFMVSQLVSAQNSDLSGYKIFINPGHGGYDSDDRHILATDFWESEGNLVKGLYLREILQKLNATVYMSRTTNTTADDLPLSTIASMANTAGVDFFLAIHSNGYDGTQNKPLMLFRGYDNEPVFPEAKEIALVMWQKLFEKGNCWTGESVWVKGDWTFYPEWGDKVGLGVLRTLTMAGVLSEGSFHDYIPESWRLRNEDFLHHESWAFTRTILDHENTVPLPHGIIAGVARDTLQTPTWYFKPGTRDSSLPVNGVTVTLDPSGRVYNVDQLNNGFYMFDSLPPGDYKLYFSGLDDYFRDTLEVRVEANKSTLADIWLKYDTTKVPELVSYLPLEADSISFNQEFTFTFSLPMDRTKVQEALSFSPSADLEYSWDEKMKVLTVRPVTTLLSKTTYTVTISASAASAWEVPLASGISLTYVTRNRSSFKIEKTFPGDGFKEVTLYPQVRVMTDAPFNESTAVAGINVYDAGNQVLTKVREGFTDTDGKGTYFFELLQPLTVNSQYRLVIGSQVADITGTLTGKEQEIKFTTRTKAYETGNIIEGFDNISSFWDPEASGSTHGTDNPLTTFTASYDIKRSGSASGKLNYVFTGESGGVCRVFDTSKPSIGTNNSSSFAIWVFGDFSMNMLEYWFYSSGTTNQIVYVDTVDWAGWDLKKIPFSAIGGTGERLYHSVVLNQLPVGAKSGTILFDEAMVIVPTGIEEEYEEGTLPLIFPNPASESITVSYIVKSGTYATVDLYTLDGRHVANIYSGPEEPGKTNHQWTIPQDVGQGSYLVRIDTGVGAGKRSMTGRVMIIK